MSSQTTLQVLRPPSAIYSLRNCSPAVATSSLDGWLVRWRWVEGMVVVVMVVVVVLEMIVVVLEGMGLVMVVVVVLMVAVTVVMTGWLLGKRWWE